MTSASFEEEQLARNTLQNYADLGLRPPRELGTVVGLDPSLDRLDVLLLSAVGGLVILSL